MNEAYYSFDTLKGLGSISNYHRKISLVSIFMVYGESSIPVTVKRQISRQPFFVRLWTVNKLMQLRFLLPFM